MNRTIQNNQISASEIVKVNGKVLFSRIKEKIQGEDLENDKKRRANLGMIPIEKPYVTISIDNATVEVKDKINNIMTDTEKYVQESLFKSNMKKANGLTYTAINKTQNMPWVAITKEKGKLEHIDLKSELAPGLEVSLILRSYHTKFKNGISLEGVIVNEPIRYYIDKTDLSPYGLEFDDNPQPTKTEYEENGNPFDKNENTQPVTGIVTENNGITYTANDRNY